MVDTIFLDGTDAILGRFAGYVAKLGLLGKKVVVLNCNKVIITGNKKVLVSDKRHKISKIRGRHKGPFHAKKPENLVRKTIAGMLPKTARGKIVLKNIEVYRDIPYEFSKNKISEFPEYLKKSSKISKFITIEELSSQISKL